MRFFPHFILLIPAAAWITAVVFKGIYGLVRGNFSLGQALGSGGMPSVHAALVTSLTTALGIKYGVASDYFAASLVFSTIIIYDAINVRFEAGLHAKALNDIARRESESRAATEAAQEFQTFLNESIGHLPREALAGSILGILVAVVCMSI